VAGDLFIPEDILSFEVHNLTTGQLLMMRPAGACALPGAFGDTAFQPVRVAD